MKYEIGQIFTRYKAIYADDCDCQSRQDFGCDCFTLIPASYHIIEIKHEHPEVVYLMQLQDSDETFEMKEAHLDLLFELEEIPTEDHIAMSKSFLKNSKHDLLELLSQLPDDCTINDMQYLLYSRAKLQEAEESLKDDPGIPHEEALAYLKSKFNKPKPKTLEELQTYVFERWKEEGHRVLNEQDCFYMHASEARGVAFVNYLSGLRDALHALGQDVPEWLWVKWLEEHIDFD